MSSIGNSLARARDRQQLADQVAEGTLRELAALRAHTTEVASLLTGLSKNGVLGVGIANIAADGSWSKSWRAPFAAVAIVNPSAGALLVAAAVGESGQPPGNGPGMFRVPAAAFICFPLTGPNLTVYGAVAAEFSYAVYTHPQPPSAGKVA